MTLMSSSGILSIVTFAYGFAAFLYLASWVFKKPSIGIVGTWALVFSFLGNTLGIILRWIESYQLNIGHAPLSNLYESLVFFSWSIGLIYLFVEFRFKNRTIGAFTTPIAFLALAYASLSPNISDRIRPLLPALQSNWLIAHVTSCFIGYAAFALAFGLSLMYLIKEREKEGGKSMLSYFPEINILEELIHQMVVFGFLFLSVGIITGSVWANSAWGRYWGWDPKETWSLITWFVYAAMLHARLTRGWYGRRIAYLSITGFAAVLFTYFGVNLLPGLHSYGQ